MDWEFEEGSAQTGEISIVQFIHEDGMGVAYRIEGIEPATAIGHLATVLDALRDEQKEQWLRPGAQEPPDWMDEE